MAYLLVALVLVLVLPAVDVFLSRGVIVAVLTMLALYFNDLRRRREK